MSVIYMRSILICVDEPGSNQDLCNFFDYDCANPSVTLAWNLQALLNHGSNRLLDKTGLKDFHFYARVNDATE